MKNAKQLILTGLLMVALTGFVAAQRGYRHYESRGFERAEHRPAVRFYTGINHIGYRPYYYQPHYYYGYSRPSLGVVLNVLPFGYQSFYVGPDPFYYYGGVYYRPYNNN
jgi:hypothetical protein